MYHILKDLGIKTIYYFPPHVSVWGKWNAKKVMNNADLVACPYISDVEIYKQQGDHIVYSGHPLLEKVKTNKTKIEIHKQLNIDADVKLIALMPGSRRQEINNLTKPFVETAKMLLQNDKYHFVIPISHEIYCDYIINSIKEINNNVT